jgi:hypothetical protein
VPELETMLGVDTEAGQQQAIDSFFTQEMLGDTLEELMGHAGTEPGQRSVLEEARAALSRGENSQARRILQKLKN